MIRIKCLMIKPQYVSEICGGQKKVEFRTWSTSYRGDFFVGCCSTKWSVGFIAAVAELKDCVYDENEKLYHFILDNVRIIKPIPVKGKLRLFDVETENYEILKNDEEINAAYDEAEWIERKGV